VAMKKTVLVFGSIVVAVMLLFQLSKYSVISGDFTLEFILIIVAVSFFIIGIYVYRKFYQKPMVIDKEIDLKKIKKLEITEREYEVLQLISQGMSNKEIANSLFLTESTIKTHVSNLLVKLNAKRRTQAVQIAQQLNIL
jgi:DNA-binding CsgD family transcriptional regulator